MKLDAQTLSHDKIETMGKTTKMKLSENAQAQIFNMFTKNVYSDPIGTVIREITSNCFDSHVEAGVNDPVIVRLQKISNEEAYISFIDKGVGMSPNRVENIYGTYFESTKRDTNNEIGGFGIGGKTPLAYANAFFVITRFDGIEYVYNIFVGNDSPVIELVSQTSTTKRNGTEVKVPVLQKDIHEFEKKTLRQLYYFENVIFEGFNEDIVQNDYTIVKGKTFMYRGNDYSPYIHAVYGRVAYPLDFDALGINSWEYDFPVAIKLEIGELEGSGVTVSRESLDYSSENKKIILKKIELAIAELKELLSKQADNVRTLEDYYKVIDNVQVLHLNNSKINLSSVVKKNDVSFPNFKYNDLRIPSASDVINSLFEVKIYGKKHTQKWKDQKWNGGLNVERIEELGNVYFTKGEFKRVIKKQRYLKDNKHQRFYVIIPNDFTDKDVVDSTLINFGIMKRQSTLSGLFEDEMIMDAKKGLSLIKEFRSELLSMIEKVATDYDSVKVPAEWIESRKSVKKLTNIGIPVNPIRGRRTRMKLSDLAKMKGKFIYGFNDDEYALYDAMRFYEDVTDGNVSFRIGYGRGYVFARISKQNEKYMKMLGKKAIHVSNFIKYMGARKQDKIIDAYMKTKAELVVNEIPSNIRKRELMKIVSPKVYNALTNIYENVVSESRINGIRKSMFEYETAYFKKFCEIFGVDKAELNAKNPIIKDAEYVKDVAEKNKALLNIINIPYDFMGDENKKEDALIIKIFSENFQN